MENSLFIENYIWDDFHFWMYYPWEWVVEPSLAKIADKPKGRYEIN